ncbi:MAG: hypothetical protein ACREFX_12730 [Opitutaceae bacterium]
MPPRHDPLDSLLRRCGEPPEAPAGLEERVFRRIANRRHSEGWLARIDRVFGRPSFAAAFVAGCVLLGLFTAEVRVARAQARHTVRLERSYLELVDPMLEAAGNPAASGAHAR